MQSIFPWTLNTHRVWRKIIWNYELFAAKRRQFDIKWLRFCYYWISQSSNAWSRPFWNFVWPCTAMTFSVHLVLRADRSNLISWEWFTWYIINYTYRVRRGEMMSVFATLHKNMNETFHLKFLDFDRLWSQIFFPDMNVCVYVRSPYFVACR